MNQITPLEKELADGKTNLAGLNTQKDGVAADLDTKESQLAAANTRLTELAAAATTAQTAVNTQIAAIEKATQELVRRGVSN